MRSSRATSQALQPESAASSHTNTTVTAWVQLLTAGLVCRHGLPDCINHSLCSSGASVVAGTTWQLCGGLLSTTCTALSVGIGGDWLYEKELRRHGCHVHGFDPTRELRAQHQQQAAAANVSFHFAGLGHRAGSRNAYGAIDSSTLAPLGNLFAAAGATGAVDVLKIDCEGCHTLPRAHARDLSLAHARAHAPANMLLRAPALYLLIAVQL